MEISEKDWKNLNNEVVTLRDELARMKRVYEDLLYNLDDDNFSGRFLKEKNGMKASIFVAENEIRTLVQKDTELGKAIETTTSSISQTANEIRTEVSNNYETKENASVNYSNLSSQISQTESKIETKVSKDNFGTLFSQTTEGFTFDGDKTKFSGVIFLTNNDLKNKFSIFYDDSQGYEQILLHSVATDEDGNGYVMPIVIGNGEKPNGIGTDIDVFVGSVASGNEIATRGWVENDASVKAVFG